MAEDEESSKKGRRPTVHPGENVGATAPKATHSLAPHTIEGQVFFGKEEILQLFGNVGNLRAVRKSRGISTQAIVITGVAAILLLSFIVLFVYGFYRTRGSREWDECYTPECRLAADYVKEHITEDIDPCQDFYGYVCNTWAHRRASALSFLEDVKDDFWSHLNRTLLSVTNPQPVDAGGRHLMFSLYSKCFAFMTTTESVHDSVEHVIAVTEVRRLMQRNTFRDLFVEMIQLSLVRGVTTLFELAFRRVSDYSSGGQPEAQ